MNSSKESINEALCTLSEVSVSSPHLHVEKPDFLNVQKEITFKSLHGEHTGRMLPLKNTGNIHLDTELSIVSAQELFTVVPQAILLAPGQEVNVLVKYTPKEIPSLDTGWVWVARLLQATYT